MTGASPNLALPTVRAVTNQEIASLRERYGKWSPNLGGGLHEEVVAHLQDKLKEGAEAFLVEWQGSKIPRGAQIHGVSITWTQNGVVTGSGGRDLGTYERLVEFGGASGREQKMLVFARKEDS